MTRLMYYHIRFERNGITKETDANNVVYGGFRCKVAPWPNLAEGVVAKFSVTDGSNQTLDSTRGLQGHVDFQYTRECLVLSTFPCPLAQSR